MEKLIAYIFLAGVVAIIFYTLNLSVKHRSNHKS
jgi:hypothetical protein